MGLTSGYKQTEVGVIPEDWEVKPLDALADKIMVGIASAATHAYRDRGIVLLRNQNIKPGYLDDCDILYIAPDYEVVFKNKRLKEGDLLTARTGYPGTTCVVPPLYECAQSFTTLITRLNPRAVRGDFLCCYINSSQGQAFFAQNKIGGGQKNINAGTLRHFPVPLPPTKAEQETIAGVLNDADTLIESLGKLIEKKRHIKRGSMQELLTGEIRLPGFTGTWEAKKIGEFTDCTSGGTPSTLMLNYWNGPIRWMSSGELNLKSVFEVEGRITEEGLRNSSTNLIPPNCVLVGLAGQGKTRGTVAMNRVELCTNQSIAAILPNATFDSEYLYYNLDARYGELRELSTGAGGRGGLNLTIIRSLTVPFPKLDEQTAIATILSNIDAEIAALEGKLAKCRQLKQGMTHNLLTGKIRLVHPAMASVKPNAAFKDASVPTPTLHRTHTWAFNEAVIISMLADQFGKPDFPLGRKRCTKLSYLIHRKADQDVQGYLKKAAGPYNPRTKYGGPEKIAQENGYVRQHEHGMFKGFIAGEKIEQAKAYFAKWYGSEIAAWAEQFRFKKTDELECLATVDMAMQELRQQDKTVGVESIRALIASEPEWLPKLERSVFSDSAIATAITQCQDLFG